MRPDNLHTNDSDLFDHLAEMGQSSVSEEDLLDIHQRIDKKVKAQSLKGNSNGISIVLVTGFTAMLLFVLFNKKTVVQIGATSSVQQENPGDLLTNALQLDTAVVSDTAAALPQPLAAIKETNQEKEHFEKENMDVHFSEEIRPDELDVKEVPLIDTVKSTPQLPDNYLDLLPNAPVIYIYDLKVTDFQKLYFKNRKPYVIDGKSLSSEFESADTYNAWISDWNPTNDYTLDMLLKDALKAFKKQKYKKSYTLFNELLTYNAGDVNALFYSALAQYNTGSYPDAIGRLDKVLENENNVFGQEAEWYKALCLLKNNQQKEAVSLLAKINTQKGFYSSNAGEKLKEILSGRQ
jgi:tetratricopeptide (TPR) repeat protein